MGAQQEKQYFWEVHSPKDFGFFCTGLGGLQTKSFCLMNCSHPYSNALFFLFLPIADVNRPETKESCSRERASRHSSRFVAFRFPDGWRTDSQLDSKLSNSSAINTSAQAFYLDKQSAFHLASLYIICVERWSMTM